MRTFKFHKSSFTFKSEVEFFFEKFINKFGDGAKIDAPKKYMGRKVIVLVCKK